MTSAGQYISLDKYSIRLPSIKAINDLYHQQQQQQQQQKLLQEQEEQQPADQQSQQSQQQTGDINDIEGGMDNATTTNNTTTITTKSQPADPNGTGTGEDPPADTVNNASTKKANGLSCK
jgi:TolA-binding protein